MYGDNTTEITDIQDLTTLRRNWSGNKMYPYVGKILHFESYSGKHMYASVVACESNGGKVLALGIHPHWADRHIWIIIKKVNSWQTGPADITFTVTSA